MATGALSSWGGFPGAGKSTILEHHLGLSQTAHPDGYVVVDPDDFKVALLRAGGVMAPPELAGFGLDPASMAPGELAGLVHAESVDVALLARREVTGHGWNVAVATTLKSDAVAERILADIPSSYRVDVLVVDVDVIQAKASALERWRRGLAAGGDGTAARFVAESVIDAQADRGTGRTRAVAVAKGLVAKDRAATGEVWANTPAPGTSTGWQTRPVEWFPSRVEAARRRLRSSGRSGPEPEGLGR